MTTALVTGGAGFIGSHLVDALLSNGHTVRVLDDYSSGKKENLPSDLDRIKVFEGDLRDTALLERAIQGVDWIFHQAAFVSVPQSLEDPDSCLDINLRGTRQLLELSRQSDVKRVVLASSAAVYGENTEVPLTEDLLPDPLSPYAVSKYVTEILSDFYTRKLGLDVVALRYFNVYGPRQNPDSDYAAVIPIFIKHMHAEEEPIIYGDGGQSRDFIYVADVVNANLLAARSKKAPGSAINICSGKETSLLDLINALSSIFNRDIQPEFQEMRAGDIYRSLGNPSLARELMGFETKTGLIEGLKKTADWMKGSSHE